MSTNSRKYLSTMLLTLFFFAISIYSYADKIYQCQRYKTNRILKNPTELNRALKKFLIEDQDVETSESYVRSFLSMQAGSRKLHLCDHEVKEKYVSKKSHYLSPLKMNYDPRASPRTVRIKDKKTVSRHQYTLNFSAGRVMVEPKKEVNQDLSLLFGKVGLTYSFRFAEDMKFSIGPSLVYFSNVKYNYNSSIRQVDGDSNSIFYEATVGLSKFINPFSFGIHYDNLNYFVIEGNRYLKPKRADRLAVSGSVILAEHLVAFAKLGKFVELFGEIDGLDYSLGAGIPFSGGVLKYMLSFYYYYGGIKTQLSEDDSVSVGSGLSISF
ncbi:MAG: hypothetical protein HOE90_08490 [Bacteriovoracaceae bacterium]|nr:hypothetical protein [Bacteriovoracaceae bacterium]